MNNEDYAICIYESKLIYTYNFISQMYLLQLYKDDKPTPAD